jgi:predicted transcriptional regulator
MKFNKKLINQSELARQTGYSQPYVNMLLSGARTSKKAIKAIENVIKDLSRIQQK